MSANILTDPRADLVCISEKPGAASSTGQPRKELNEHTNRLEEIIEQVERFPNPAAKALMHECLQSLLAMYGEGLGRMITVLQADGVSGEKLLSNMAEDKLVRSLLLVHGLHPIDLETRLKTALDQVRPYMQSHGGNVEIVSLQDDFARLRLLGACKGCPSSRVTLELAVRKAVEDHCPDLIGFDVEMAE
ncbi:MAG TPA: NifU family protein [Candidatus Dormibacteraeota bacterium]|nr:NifU family protein [Candidatus Dormibacteraeota bacterium]